MVKSLQLILLQFILFCAAVIGLVESALGESSVLKLSAGGHIINTEVAATLEERDLGLMNRRSLPDNRGMLFVFPEARRHCMWMMHTRIPLSVAFIDDAGRIINIEDMQPDTSDYHCAAKPVRYALEMERGWFKKRGIGAGSRIEGLAKAPIGR